MIAPMKRTVPVRLSVVAALVLCAIFAGTVMTASSLQPEPAPAAAPAAPVPQGGVAGEKLDAQNKAAEPAKPYEAAEYRRFPVVGSRVAIWVVAQLHLLFAAFVLA